MKQKPVHKSIPGAPKDDSVLVMCESYKRPFKDAVSSYNWAEVTCKRCLKLRRNFK